MMGCNLERQAKTNPLLKLIFVVHFVPAVRKVTDTVLSQSTAWQVIYAQRAALLNKRTSEAMGCHCELSAESLCKLPLPPVHLAQTFLNSITGGWGCLHRNGSGSSQWEGWV